MTYSFLIGVVALVAGIYQILLFLKVKSSGEAIKGRVIGYEEGRDNKMRTTYNPIVRFERNGKTLEMPTELFDSKKKFELDDEIDVYFVEGKDHVMRASGNSSLTNGLVCLACGVALLVITILLRH